MTLTLVCMCVCVVRACVRACVSGSVHVFQNFKHLIAAGQVDYRFISVLFVIIGMQVYSSFNDNRQVEIK